MGLINRNKSYEGEYLETELERITTQNIPIQALSPMYYTERNKGVMPETNIRTDRWEIAQNAMGHVSRAKIAKREQGQGVQSTTGESIQGGAQEGTK